jgi:putative membrane protein
MSETEDKPILRDFLALERTKMANERTFLSYIRTSLYFLLGGFAFINLEGFKNTIYLGYVAIGISILLISMGTVKFMVLRKRIRQKLTTHHPDNAGADENVK